MATDKQNKTMAIALKILLGLTACYALLYLFALAMANRMIFPAPAPSYPEQSSDIFFIETAEAAHPRIAARYYPASGKNATDYTLLYSHGNGEDLGMIDPRLRELAKQGVNILAYDYPGYGQTSGKPSEAGTYLAAQTAFEYLHTEMNVPMDHIILYGRSLGGGPTFFLAQQYPGVAGVITESTFTSTYRVLSRVKLLPMDAFDNLARLNELRAPLLLLHGTHDMIVPFYHGKQLLKAAPDGTQHNWFQGGGHNNLVEEFGEQYYAALNHFLSRLKTAQKNKP